MIPLAAQKYIDIRPLAPFGKIEAELVRDGVISHSMEDQCRERELRNQLIVRVERSI